MQAAGLHFLLRKGYATPSACLLRISAEAKRSKPEAFYRLRLLRKRSKNAKGERSKHAALPALLCFTAMRSKASEAIRPGVARYKTKARLI
jgi:hypothetical protein